MSVFTWKIEKAADIKASKKLTLIDMNPQTIMLGANEEDEEKTHTLTTDQQGMKMIMHMKGAITETYKEDLKTTIQRKVGMTIAQKIKTTKTKETISHKVSTAIGNEVTREIDDDSAQSDMKMLMGKTLDLKWKSSKTNSGVMTIRMP
jgi:hypothetical protein